MEQSARPFGPLLSAPSFAGALPRNPAPPARRLRGGRSWADGRQERPMVAPAPPAAGGVVPHSPPDPRCSRACAARRGRPSPGPLPIRRLRYLPPAPTVDRASESSCSCRISAAVKDHLLLVPYRAFWMRRDTEPGEGERDRRE